jgi:hypothetical protein
VGPIFRFFARHKILAALCVLLLAFCLFLGYRSIGPWRFYRADLVKPAPGTPITPGVLKVGVAKRDITPDLSKYDVFEDVNNNNKYEPDKGDSFKDTNGNGKVDAVWIAGFGNNRPAKGVHDPLWARAIAFENNGVRVAMVTVDGIGMFHEKIIDMRHRLDPALDIDHLMVSSLHNHETPDTMGIWSVGLEKPYYRFDHAHMELVIRAVVEAAEEAVRNLEPAESILAETEVGPAGYVDDSRVPLVYDNVIRCARFVKPGTDDTIATMLVWGNHPETLGGSNPLLTSDFCHYWREGVEQGLPEPNGVPGLGGMCLYFQGQVGGLMTQLHTTVPDRNGQKEYSEASFEKAQALGENLAVATVKALRGETAWKSTSSEVAVVARSVFAKPKPLFALAGFLGLVHPGWFWGKARTEVDAFRIGDIEVLTIPGELYPEIGNGGVEAPAGQDFTIAPVETPSLRSQMQGKLTMIMGLANDELGYIVPRSQWDAEAPFAYGREKDQYGEENSFGPEVAPTLHAAALEVLGELHAVLPKTAEAAR